MANPADGLLRTGGLARCAWCGGEPEYRRYHDEEWGVPVGDDRRLFEKLCLEGFQAGLSWWLVLSKRAAFRRAFAGFDPTRVARFDRRRVDRLVRDPRIIRHRGKIEAAVNNARRTLEVVEERGSLAALVWEFEPRAEERPRRLTPRTLRRLTETPASRALSKELRRRGFRFVGPTTAYAFMQAMGLVNDHLEGCHRRVPVERLRGGFQRP